MHNSALGKAFVRYRTLEEAAKAQRSLDKCQLANTTISAEFVPEHEVSEGLRGVTSYLLRLRISMRGRVCLSLCPSVRILLFSNVELRRFLGQKVH